MSGVHSSLSPSSPSLPSRRRPPASRACDRCRRRKARCDVESSRVEGACTLCFEGGERCTFDMPLGRRGPKAKRRHVHTSHDETTSPLALEQSLVSPLSGSASSSSNHQRQRQLLPTLTPDDGAIARGVSLTLDFAGGTTSQQVAVAPWDSSATATADSALSPQTIRSATSASIAAGTALPSPSAIQKWQSLAETLSLHGMPIERIVTRCFDLFFEYLYPLTPLVHEPSLREALRYFLLHSSSTPLENGTYAMRDMHVDLQSWPDATFTLITAVCAEAAFLLPKTIFAEGEMVANIFLQASRSSLHGFLEADLESPNSNSVAIRYFHSNCVHAAGKPKFSWHIFGEGTRLAQVMHLHEESSLSNLDPIEAEMRRRVFWCLYVGDKSAAILNNRPITIHKFCFESGITTAYPTDLPDESSGRPSAEHEIASLLNPSGRNVIEGFNANLRLWQFASDLILEVRLLAHQEHKGLPTESNTTAPSLASEEDRQRLETLYVRFITCLDTLPPELQSYTFASIAHRDSEATASNHFKIQCANLQVSLHCLRMVIIQKFEELSYRGLGMEQADLRKTEIARDLLRVMHEAPFWSLQINGEPYVEKIRLIGASLMAIIDRNPASSLAERARRDFSVLLDVLTRLDSKASDELKNYSTSML